MTDQTESASEYAELLRDLDAAAPHRLMGGALAERAAAAIRALEAKVRELEHQRDTHYVAKPFYNSIEKQFYDACADRDHWKRAAESFRHEALIHERGVSLAQEDRDRLAGEVQAERETSARLRRHMFVMEQEDARLTAELAAAREEIDGHENYLRSIARTHLDLAPSIEHFIGRDAARRAGGEG